MTNEKQLGWKERVLEELRKLSITILYLWVLLSVFALHREIILAHYDIGYSEKFGFAFLNALILAKFIWLGDVLHAGKKAENKTLLFSVFWNAAIFSVLLTVCHTVEDVMVRWLHGKLNTASFSGVVGVRPGEMAATWVMMFVVLIPFFFTRGLVRVLGKNETKALLFRTGPNTDTRPASS
jgi:hypothetical protein